MKGNGSSTALSLKSFDITEYQADQQRRSALPLTDPEHPTGFTIDEEAGTIDLHWGGYEYWFDLNRIKRPIQLLAFIHHIAKKGWEGMTPRRISQLIYTVCKVNNWDLYGGGGPSRRETSADEERRKLTSELRYKVLKRDGHRCRSCGAGPENGAVLQIDHITAISKGGLTEYTNLQTLCSCCNLGKRDR